MARTMLKPLARATRSPMLVRRTASAVSRELETDLFRYAEVLSEGSCRADGRGGQTYFGSTMVSVPFAALAERFRGDLDDPGARELLVRAVEGSVRVRLRTMRLACAEAARRVPGWQLGTAQLDIRVRSAAEQLHIDVDLEVPLRVSSRSRRQL